MSSSFSVIKSFIRKLVSDATEYTKLDPRSITGVQNYYDVHVERSKLHGRYHLVEIRVDVSSYANSEKAIYKLCLNYSVVAEITNALVAESQLDEILKVDVPKAVSDELRSVIYHVSRDAGFPFVLEDDAFDEKSTIEETEGFLAESVDPPIRLLDTVDNAKIDFRWIVNNLSSMGDPSFLFNVCVEYIGEDAMSNYENLPVYKGYYSFFRPIEYRHPSYVECDETVWPMLFQMLYGSFTTECHLVDYGEGAPDIQFSYGKYKGTKVSSLSLEDVKDLLSSLLLDALTNFSVNIQSFEDAKIMKQEYVQESTRLISRTDYYILYGFNDTAISLIRDMYDKIEECDIQTVLYR